MLHKEVEERARAISAANTQLARRLVENLGRCLECDQVTVEQERVAAGCATCSECSWEIQRRLNLRNKQYAR